MSDSWFALVAIIVLLFFVGVALGLLLWPSKVLRHFQNRLQPDTPWNRVQMRGVGLMLCLFVLMVISGSVKSLEGFHRNILLVLWTSPIVIPIFLWILWRYTLVQQINRRFLAGILKRPVGNFG
jgi:hypothetical protein